MFKWFHRDKLDKQLPAAQAAEPATTTPAVYVDPALAWAAALGERVAHFEAPGVTLPEGSTADPAPAADGDAEGLTAESFAAAVADAVVDAVGAEAITGPTSLPDPVTETAALKDGGLPADALASAPGGSPAFVDHDRHPADGQGNAPVIETVLGQRPAAAAALAADDAVPSLFSNEASVGESSKPRTLRERLAATARALTASVGSLFKRNPKLDEDLLEDLETALIQADVGVTASTELVAKLGVRMRKREFADAQALLAALRSDLRALVANYARPLNIPAAPRPFVILTVGVNGAGKTTTIGKLAMRYKQAGYSVMLAAGDTFRAAAVEQLKTWGERNQVTVIAQGSGADSASVIFDALQAAKSRGIDVLIADTAGRLHTQGHLMQELAKVKRVLGKIDPEAPHETLLVIDGGTGQNALNQAKQFHQAVGLNGIVVTKLDGTAKGGMVFALCRELGLPIRFIGVGEKREDLREFVAEDFVEALLPRELV